MTEVVVTTTGAIRRAKLQSNCHHKQTNNQIFTGSIHSFMIRMAELNSTESRRVDMYA